MQSESNVLSHRIDLYFHDYKLAIKIDENWRNYRNIDYEIKRQKAIEQELGCNVTRIDPDKGDFRYFWNYQWNIVTH